MIILIFENGEFSEKLFKGDTNCNSLDVNLIIKDDIPFTDRSDIIDKALCYINDKLNSEYKTYGIGSYEKSETKNEIKMISEFNFRIFNN